MRWRGRKFPKLLPRRLVQLHWYDLGRELDLIAEVIGVISRAGDQPEEEEKPEAEPSQEVHVARGQGVLVGDVNDPLPRMRGQVDLPMPGEALEIALDIRFFHEAETQLDADDAAAVLVAVEHGDVVA